MLWKERRSSPNNYLLLGITGSSGSNIIYTVRIIYTRVPSKYVPATATKHPHITTTTTTTTTVKNKTHVYRQAGKNREQLVIPAFLSNRIYRLHHWHPLHCYLTRAHLHTSYLTSLHLTYWLVLPPYPTLPIPPLESPPYLYLLTLARSRQSGIFSSPTSSLLFMQRSVFQSRPGNRIRSYMFLRPAYHSDIN